MIDNIDMNLILQESRALYESMKRINVAFSNISGTTLDNIAIVNTSSFADEIGIISKEQESSMTKLKDTLRELNAISVPAIRSTGGSKKIAWVEKTVLDGFMSLRISKAHERMLF